MRTKIANLFREHTVTIHRWQLDIVIGIYVILGILIGVVVVLLGIIPRASALQQQNNVVTSDSDFAQGTLTATAISGSGTAGLVQLAGTPPADSWLGSGWLYRKQLSLQNSTGQALTNFPLAVVLNSTNFDFTKAKTDGSDIRFTDSNGSTLLSYEIEHWDNVAQIATLWVKVPQIDVIGFPFADYIYIYYGNSGASDAQNVTDVWSNGYAAVWHMHNNPAGVAPQMQDSTSNNRDLTMQGGMTIANLVDGKVGKAIDFDGVNDYFTLSTTGLNFATGHIEAWVKRDTNVYSTIFADPQGTCQAYLDIRTDNLIHVQTFGTCSSGSLNLTTAIAGSLAWNYINYYGTTNAHNLFVNGNQVTPVYSVGSATVPLFLDDLSPGTTNYYIGGNGFVDEYFNGIIDEFRISNVTRTSQWISAQYQNIEGSFVTFSSEQTPLPASGTWESSTGAGVIDLNWNGGWGDGTSGSTAFAANVANVGVNGSVTFQMRVGNSIGSLTGASYQTLGIANSGTTFTRTANDLNVLGLGTGNNRYVQIRATLSNANGVTNPQLQDFTISYLADNTAPETNATNLQMQKTQGGQAVLSNEWTNSAAPYFSWVAGLDTQSGVRGYCMYLGTDSTGNPTISKGILGTSPADTTGTGCLFLTNSTYIDFADPNLRGSPWLTSGTQPYYLNIRAVDVAGNVTLNSVQFQFRFDNTPPNNPAFISLPAGFISSKDATFTWPISGPDAANDSHSGLAGIQYRVTAAGTWYGSQHNGVQDPPDFLANTGSYTTDPVYDYPLLSDGNNVIYIRTWDNAGNVTTQYTSGSLKINTSAPSAPQNLQVAPASNTSNQYSASWSAPATYVGSQNSITYCYTVNVLPSAITCNFTPAGVTTLGTDAYASQPGNNTLFVVAKDEAGNINYSTYASFDFSYTGSAPGMPTSVDVADISIKSSSNWRLVVSWNAPQNVGAGIAYYQVLRKPGISSCSEDIGQFVAVGTTPGTSYTDTGLIQQDYSYCVKACDSANSCSAASETGNGFPDGRFTEPPNLVEGPTVTSVSNRTATIAWTTDRKADTKVAFGLRTGEYFVEEPVRSEQVTQHQISLNNLQPGTTYFYQAKWLDEDGNLGVAEEGVFSTLPPPAVSDVVIQNIGLSSAQVRFTATRAAAIRVQYGLTASFGGVKQIATAYSAGTYTVELDNLQDGTTYSYRVDAVDADNFAYPGTILEFTTVPKPRISNVQVQEVVGEPVPTIELTWQTNTPTTSIVTYYLEDNPEQVLDEVKADYTNGEHKIRIGNLDANKKYIVQVKGRDRLGNEAASDIQRVSTGLDSRPPKISNLRIEGAVVSVGASLGEAPSAQLIVSWDTDEPATSQVQFGAGTGETYSDKTQKDVNLSLNHLVVISNLQPSQVYHLQVISEDLAANQSVSVDTVTITPKATQTAVEVVLKNLRDIFSFLQ